MLTRFVSLVFTEGLLKLFNDIPSSPEYQNWLDSGYNQTACNSDPEDLLLFQVAVEAPPKKCTV